MKPGRLSPSRTVPALFVAVMSSLMCHAAEPPAGVVVAAIQTATGNYLTAVNGGVLAGPGTALAALRTDATVAGPWQTFTVVWVDSAHTQFALQTSDGHYVTAVGGGGMGGPNNNAAPVHTDAKTIGNWETLTLNFLPNNQLTIKVPNGRFLTAVNGGGMTGPTPSSPIQTTALHHAAWETFTLVKLGAAHGGETKEPPTDADPVLRRLNQSEGGHWGKSPDATNPSHLFSDGKSRPRFDPKTATADVVTQAALGFLTEYADLWQLKDPAKELKRRSAQPGWQVEFTQWNGGVRVFDAGIDVSFYGNGKPQSIASRYIPGLDSLNKSPKLTPAQANQAARQHLATTAQVPLEGISVSEKPMLGISAPQRNEPARTPRLIYRLTLMFDDRAATPRGYGATCEIDARTGEVLSEQYLRPLTARPIR
jgi:hypothetical protein